MKRVIAAVVLAGLAAAPAARAASPEGQEKFSAFAVDLGGSYGASTSHGPDQRRPLVHPRGAEQPRSPSSPRAAPDALLRRGAEDEAGGPHLHHRAASDTTSASRTRSRWRPAGAASSSAPTARSASTRRRSRPRSVDYPFTVLEMRVDENGRGQGNLIVAGKVMALGETIEIENYTTTPVRLMQVRLDK